MLVSNTADYIDYVTVDDFLKLQLAEPFRTFTDDDLINYSVREGNNKPMALSSPTAGSCRTRASIATAASSATIAQTA